MAVDDLQIARQLSAALIGSVRIQQLDQVIFEDIDVLGSRALNVSNIDRLVHRFEYEGCRRGDPLTWVPCKLKQSDFQHILPSSSENGDPPAITLSHGWKLHCFQGKHRIAAARRWLPPNDLCWNFEVYDADKLNENCQKKLRECEKRSHTFSDGEIFRNVRYYQQRGKIASANEWLARWSPTKCREFTRIYEPKENKCEFRDLADSLDSLLCFPALWTSWHMGTHLPSLRCPEELADSLRVIYSTWKTFTCDRPHLLDDISLEMLQGRCPRLSKADCRYITEIFRNGLAFPMARDPNLRSQILHSILSYPRIIPSLKTFLENTKYLKAMTDVIKKVLPVSFKRTIRQTMIRSYVAQGPRVTVQSSENNFSERDGTGKYGFWSAYRQLFLFAMRHFCPLTDEHPHGFSQLARSRCLDQSELWQRLKNLLAKLGFVLPRSQNNVLASSVECIAIRTFLTRLRPPELFVYDEGNISEWSTKIAEFLCSMPLRVATGPAPAQTWDKTEDWCLGQRCGMTNTETFFSDQRYLFLENIYSADQAAQENITTFAVKRDIFRFFFTELDDIGPGLLQCSGTIKDMSTSSDQSGEGQLAITIPQQVDSIQDHNGTNQDAEMNDLVEYTVTPAAFPPSNALSIIHPQTEIAPNATTNSQDPFPNIKIVSQSDKACNCTIGLTPDDFYTSFTNMPAYWGIIFCEIDTREVLFLRGEFANEFYNMINDLGDRWFARVDGPNFPLKTLAIGDIPALFQTLPCFIFHGRKGSLKSKLSPTMATAIKLPCFNPETNMWVLQSGN